MSGKQTPAEKAAVTIQLAYDDARRADPAGEAAVNLRPLTTFIEAAIEEAEHDNRSIIASQQIVLKEKRARIEKLEAALRGIVNEAVSQFAFVDKFFWCYVCNRKGKQPSSVDHREDCPLRIGIAALASVEERGNVNVVV